MTGCLRFQPHGALPPHADQERGSLPVAGQFWGGQGLIPRKSQGFFRPIRQVPGLDTRNRHSGVEVDIFRWDRSRLLTDWHTLFMTTCAPGYSRGSEWIVVTDLRGPEEELVQRKLEEVGVKCSVVLNK